MRAILLTILLTGAALAGCIGGDDAGDDEVRRAAADVDANTGGIEGVVTDVAIAPLGGVTVTLVELDLTTATESDGSFAFSNVPPGTYTVEATLAGFVPSQETLTVEAGAVSVVDLLLSELATDRPFSQVFDLPGFMECGFNVGANESGVRQQVVAWTICEDVERTAPNSTNDRTVHHFHLEAPVEDVILEAEWTANNPFSDKLRFIFQYEGSEGLVRGELTLNETEGTSPLLFRIGKEDFERMAQFFKDSCEEDANSEFCGLNPWDNGWDITLIAFPPANCMCVYNQQSYQVYVSAFYNTPAPEGWSVVGGNTPEV